MHKSRFEGLANEIHCGGHRTFQKRILWKALLVKIKNKNKKERLKTTYFRPVKGLIAIKYCHYKDPKIYTKKKKNSQNKAIKT